MSSFTNIFTFITQLFFLVWTYLAEVVSILAASLEPQAPPPELPISSKSPASFTVHSQTSHPRRGQEIARNHAPCGLRKDSKPSQNNSDGNRTTDARPVLNKMHSEMRKPPIMRSATPSNYIRDQENVRDPCDISLTTRMGHSPDLSDDGSSLSFTTDENFTDIFSPTLSLTSNCSVYSTSFSSPPATPVLPCSPTDVHLAFPPDVNAHRTHVEQWVKTLGSAQGIGGLGKRRGFKGAPLFTSDTAKKLTFLAVPSAFSPRTPRSPLTPMTNFIKTSTRKRSYSNEKQVLPSLQDDFDLNDPFGTNSDSYYAPKVVYTIIPTANMENFMSYQNQPPARAPSLKRKPAIADLHSPPPTEPTFQNPNLTNIYDISIYQDIDMPTKSKFKSKFKSSSQQAHQCESVEIKLTPPSAPSSPKRWSPFPTEQVLVPIVETIANIHDISVADRSCNPNGLFHETLHVFPLDQVSTSIVNPEDIRFTVPADSCNLEDLVCGQVNDAVRMPIHAQDIQYPAKVPQSKLGELSSDDHFIHQDIKFNRRTGGVFPGIQDASASAALDSTAIISRKLTQGPLDDASSRVPTIQAAFDESHHVPSTLYSRHQGNATDNLEHNKLVSGAVSPFPVLRDPKRFSGLRPLVLPLQVAKRNAALAAVSAPCHTAISPWPPLTSGPDPVVSSSFTPVVLSACLSLASSNPVVSEASISASKTPSTDSPIPAPFNRRSKALDDIVTLLAAADFNLSPKEDLDVTHDHGGQDIYRSEDEHWSDGLLETYAI